jgi:hypothetical protein
MPEPYELKYNCGQQALAFHKDHTSRAKLLIGPFGTGKTSSAAYDQIMCQSKRVKPFKDGIKRSRFAVVRNTYPQLRDTTIKTYMDWFPPYVFGQYLESKKTYTVRIEDRIIEIIFKALDTEKDVRDLLSLELTGAEVDEAREIKQDIFKGLLGRVGRYPSLKDFDGEDPFITPPQITLTTNYPSREHWLHKDFVSEMVDGYQIYEQDQSENKHNLRPGYYEDLENDYATRPDLLRTLVRGEWGVTVKGKEVYPEFNRKVHVADEDLLPIVKEGIKAGRQIIRGWDNTGLSPACAVTYINSVGQWYIVREFVDEDVDIIDFAEMVLNWCQRHFGSHMNYRDICDPGGNIRDSRKKSPAQYMSDELGMKLEDGIQTFKVRKSSVVGRLNRMANGEPAFVVDPSCVRLIDGFEGGYAYPEIGSSGVFKPEPAKNEYSHIHDAIQYPATMLFGAIYEDHHEQYEDHYDSRQGRSAHGGY